MRLLIIFSFIGLINVQAQNEQKINPNNAGTTISPNYQPEDWRNLSNQGKYLEAASELLYLVQLDSSRNAHSDYWHIGQLYADDNQYHKAIFYLKKSMEGKTEEDDEQFWWYYKGTLAFLERDKDQLKKYTELLQKNHTPYYLNNAKTLNRLLTHFDKSYEKAIRSKP